MNDRTRDDYDLNQILHPAQVFGHPSCVLGDPGVTLSQKRAILAPARSRLRPIYDQMRTALRCCSTTSWKRCGHSIDKPPRAASGEACSAAVPQTA